MTFQRISFSSRKDLQDIFETKIEETFITRIDYCFSIILKIMHFFFEDLEKNSDHLGELCLKWTLVLKHL